MKKELKAENIAPVEEVKKKIWAMFETLKGNLPIEDFHVSLFLVSAYKDGLISENGLLVNPNLKKQLFAEFQDSKNELASRYFKIFSIYKFILDRLSTEVLTSLVYILHSIERELLSENFPDIFDSVLYRIAQSQGRGGGEFIQPVELTRFISGLIKLESQSRVYNPFAGLASFGVYLEEGQYYFGQEINQQTWALGTLRIMAYGRLGTSRYVCEDSITNWPSPYDEKFDLIISNPPFGLKVKNPFSRKNPNNETVEHFLLENGFQSLKSTGTLITILTQGFLYRGSYEQQLREYLIEADLIDTIIALPGGLLSNTSIPLVIMIICKHKKLQGRIRFIDAKKFVETKEFKKEKVLNDYALSNLIRGNNQDPELIRIVDIEKIKSYDYNLSIPRYFHNKIEGVKLGDILEVKGHRSNLPKSGKFIRIRDLKDDKVDFKLNIENVEVSELGRQETRTIEESCLLLAMRWKTLKPTFFEFSGEPIFRNPDILSFKVNESLADIAYLINELHSDYVKEQLESYRLGTAIPFIRKDDLLEVVIKLPSLAEQRAKVQGIFESKDEVKHLQEERNLQAHNSAVKQFSEFASLKHTLGRPRQNILDWSDNILDFINSKRPAFELLNNSFAEYYGTDIYSALEEIKRDVNFITVVLEKGENGLVIDKYEKQIISLSDINAIIIELSSNGLNFKLKKLLIKGEKLKERGIVGNKTLFKILLNNLLTNASKYGFDKNATGNEVVIELTEVEDVLSVEVRNNGKPFPKNFDREKFITKYSTADSSSGSGLGGYDIHRIATYFMNQDWELLLNKDPLYPVKFKFLFNVKLIS